MTSIDKLDTQNCEPITTKLVHGTALSYAQLNTLGKLILKGKNIFKWVRSYTHVAPPPTATKSSQTLFSFFPILAVIFPNFSIPNELVPSAPTSSLNNTFTQAQEVYGEIKDEIDRIQQLPAVEGLKDLLIAKQTFSFSYSLLEWQIGDCSTLKLFNQGVNTLLVWSPKILAAIKGFENEELLQVATLISGVCLTYSFAVDAYSLIRPNLGKCNPFVRLCSSIFDSVGTALNAFA